jgi:hypothetical protein
VGSCISKSTNHFVKCLQSKSDFEGREEKLYTRGEEEEEEEEKVRDVICGKEV